MTLEIFFVFVFVLFFIYAILVIYIYHAKIVPFLKKKNFTASRSRFKQNRQINEYLDGFSNDADKPWFYYFLEYRYVLPIIMVLILLLLEL
jgi:hypothetical protein